VERRGGEVTGLAVHVGARVAALAGVSEVLVTGTVQMLVLGSGIGFADRGIHTLKGVPGQWRLFAVEHA
jgi:class 3 adenylate cyclase